MGKIKELREEVKTVFSGRSIKLLDTILPLFVFLLGNTLFGLNPALLGALAAAILLTGYRLIQGENLLYALAGIGGVMLSAGFVRISGSEAGFFLPGLFSGGITVLLCLGSTAVKRPLAAWSSYLTRRWPLKWYWHSKVRPAYTEVTLIWAVASGARTGLEYWLFQREAINALGVVKVILGWPYTILVLIFSYLYGIWRLGNLMGPSVNEFTSGVEPPWIGQKRGF